jgi:enoyl-CoA hydratase/carnithine racemase
MTDEPLVLERYEQAIAILTLNRPARHNAVNHELGRTLGAIVDRLAADDAVRVIVLTGAGEKAFCAGADMAEMTDSVRPEGPGGARYATDRVAACPKPVIAAVNGYCYGGGAALAAVCDIRIASRTATFRFPGAEYGLVVGAAHLPRLVGAAVAKDLLLTARRFDAEEAARIGFANRVVEPEDLLPAVMDLAGQIAANSPVAVQATKAVIDAASLSEQALTLEAEANRRLRAGDDHRTRFRDAARRVVGRSSSR